MGIEGKYSSISFCIVWQFLPLIICCKFTGFCFYPPFWRPKGCKRHSTDKISHSLLGSQIFASENIAFGELRLRSLQV